MTWKNHFKIKNLPGSIENKDDVCKSYLDNIFKNDIDFNDIKLENIKFVKVNNQPAVNKHLTPKILVDNAIEKSIAKNNRDKIFNSHNLSNKKSINLNTQAVNVDHVITNAYVDQFHQENEQSRRNVGLHFYNESTDLVKHNEANDLNDNKLTKLDSITVKRIPSSDKELANKNYVDDSIGEGNVLRFNQTLQK